MYKLGKWKYVNHLNEEFQSDGTRVLIEDNSILDFSRKYETSRGRVLEFQYAAAEKTLPIVLHGVSPADGIELRNQLYEITQRDVLAMKPGRFYLGDWYLTGYVTASEKKDFMVIDELMRSSLTFVAEKGLWRKDFDLSLLPQKASEPKVRQTKPIVKGHPGSTPVKLKEGSMYPDFSFEYYRESTLKLTFPLFDYSFDYAHKAGSSAVILSDALAGSSFVMTIFGPCIHPVVTIAGHPYGVNATVYENERLVIDSEKRTITKIGRLGEETNLFYARDKDHSVFQPIPDGSSVLVWPGTYGLDLVVHEERAEPAWNFSS